jgi:hypothetical protein
MVTIAHKVTVEIWDGANHLTTSDNSDTLIDSLMVRAQCDLQTATGQLTLDRAYTLRRPGGGGDWVNMYCEELPQASPSSKLTVGGGVAKFSNRRNSDGGPDHLSPKYWKF